MQATVSDQGRSMLNGSPMRGPGSPHEASQAPGMAAARGNTLNLPAPSSSSILMSPEYRKLCTAFLEKQLRLVPEVLLADVQARAQLHITMQADSQAAPAPATPAAGGGAYTSSGSSAGGFAAVAAAAMAAAAGPPPPCGVKHLLSLLSKEALALLSLAPPPPPPPPLLLQGRLAWRPEPPAPPPKSPPLTGGNSLTCMLRAYIQRHQAGIVCTLEKCKLVAESFKAYDAIDIALDVYRTRWVPDENGWEGGRAAHVMTR